MKIESAVFIGSASDPSHYPAQDIPAVAFVGRSNVGKSSMINSLVQRKGLARTSRTPGCTQQIHFYRINNKIYFVDLPGYGFAKVPQSVKKNWGPMVETYLRDGITRKIVILIMDIRRDPRAEEINLINWFCLHNISYVLVLTKTDKLSNKQIKDRLILIQRGFGQEIPSPEIILFSAMTGEGKDKLWKKIRDVLAVGST